ncbi:MAG TPA: hypothetical protein VF121_19760 [Thermoanaerobaculia bacterium]|nr:hypothetical protein [Thermoanaerobaculia bacterium]
MHLIPDAALVLLLAGGPVPELAATAASLRERAMATDHAYDLAHALVLEVGAEAGPAIPRGSGR